MKRAMMILALATAAPIAARDLPVPPGKSWQHAETGLILRSQLAGLPRGALTDATQSEHDVAAQFEAPDGSVSATVYLFHPAVPDVALWFDRSRTAIESRDLFRNAAPASADPIAFAAPGATAASSLRQVYANAGKGYRSTALAVVPVGEWIVSIRMSAKALTAEQLDAQLQQAIATIHWPRPAGPAAPAATPIRACATPLVFTHAKPIKPAGGDMLMALLAGSIAAKAKADPATPPQPRPSWCREGDARLEYGVYRAHGAGYEMALYDAGRTVSVYPSLMGQIEKSGTYTVALTDVDGTVSSFPSFDGLPTPKQVWELVASGKRTGVSKGNQVTIDAKSVR